MISPKWGIASTNPTVSLLGGAMRARGRLDEMSRHLLGEPELVTPNVTPFYALGTNAGSSWCLRSNLMKS